MANDSRPESLSADAIRERWMQYLRPSTVEADYEITEIEGELPREIHGTLYRNGPSQVQAPSAGAEAMHLFDGDGLVHRFHFEDGRAFYRSRFVRTESFLYEQAQGRQVFGGVGYGPDDAPEDIVAIMPNTNVVPHAGKLFAMVENRPPFEIDPETLDPIGLFDYDGKMCGMSTTAHPKIDGRTGQMLIHGYQPVEPYGSFYIVEPDGKTSLAEPLELPWPSMLHDFAITESCIVLPLPPLYFDVQVLAEGGAFSDALSWQPERGMKFGIRSREPGGAMQWFDAPTPGYIFHPGNAYEEDGVIYMDACTYLDPKGLLADLSGARSGNVGGGLHAVPFLYEFDLTTGECRERQLSDRPAEFPRIDDRLVGHPNRFGYAATARRDYATKIDGTFTGLIKYDRRGGPNQEHALRPGCWAGEPIFVPKSADAAEDEGFVLSVIYDGVADASTLEIFDAQNLADAPLARLHLRDRIPLGFHGNYLPGDR